LKEVTGMARSRAADSGYAFANFELTTAEVIKEMEEKNSGVLACG